MKEQDILEIRLVDQCICCCDLHERHEEPHKYIVSHYTIRARMMLEVLFYSIEHILQEID